MANITRFDPFADLARFDPWRQLDEFMRVPGMRASLRDWPDEPQIRIDVTEDPKAYHVKAEIPGVRKEDIKVSVDGNGVSIAAEVKREQEEKKGETVLRSERYYGRQSRSFSLASDIDRDGAEAKYDNGVLDLVLPKKAGSPVKELAVK